MMKIVPTATHATANALNTEMSVSDAHTHTLTHTHTHTQTYTSCMRTMASEDISKPRRRTISVVKNTLYVYSQRASVCKYTHNHTRCAGQR